MPYFHGLGHWSARSSQLIASPHVLKFAKSVALLFAQQVRQGLREPRWYGFAPVQVPGYTPVHGCNVRAERLFSAHGNDLPSPQPPTVSPSLRTVAGTTTSLPLPTVAGPVIWGRDIQSLRIPLPVPGVEKPREAVMADVSSTTLSEMTWSQASHVSGSVGHGGPFVHTDWIGNHGQSGEVVTFTLEAHRNMTIGDKMVRDRVVVAHLQMPVHTMRALKSAIEQVELLLKQPASDEKN